jgi:hypothetical protein
LNKVAHTTLTRFVNGHPSFWKNLEKLIQKVILSTSSEKMILVVDDTQLARRSKKIPFTTPTYDPIRSVIARHRFSLPLVESAMVSFLWR